MNYLGIFLKLAASKSKKLHLCGNILHFDRGRKIIISCKNRAKVVSYFMFFIP